MQLESDRAPTVLPKVLRILPVSSGILFPRGILRLVLRKPSDIELINDAMGSDRFIGVIQSNENDPSASEQTLYGTGCLGRVKQFTDEEDGSYVIKLRGLLRFIIERELQSAPHYRQCRVNFERFACDLSTENEEETVDREAVLNTLDRFIAAYPQRIDWDAIHEASNEVLLNGLAIQSPFSRAEKQALLEAHDLKTRAEILISLMEFEVTKVSGGSKNFLARSASR